MCGMAVIQSHHPRQCCILMTLVQTRKLQNCIHKASVYDPSAQCGIRNDLKKGVFGAGLSRDGGTSSSSQWGRGSTTIATAKKRHGDFSTKRDTGSNQWETSTRSKRTIEKSRDKRVATGRDSVLESKVVPTSLVNGSDTDTDIDLLESVVKVFCVHTEPNYSLPWQRKRQVSSTSSGFLVAGPNNARWLLTNAHSVEYHSQVKVKRRGDDRKFIAQVLAISPECDIALLTVAEDEFWTGAQPIQLGSLPALQDSVYVVGYPLGGDTISVTSGVVSRIEVTIYSHGATELLGVQIDAAINSGNSGGPVFEGSGQCVGIAFQSYAGSDVENIGWIIPTPVIHHFLDDYLRNGPNTAFPVIGMKWQRMESEALRSSFGMTKDQKGILIRSLAPTSQAAKILQPGDILQRFEGVNIACDGTVPFLSGERIAFSYLTSQRFVGDKCSLDILRKGEQMTLEVELMRPAALVPHHLNGKDPSYLVIAGVVFTVASEPYFQSEYGIDYIREAPVKLLDCFLHEYKQAEDEEIVLVSQVLACDATVGYEDLHNIRVKAFNGKKVRNLRELAEMVLRNQDSYLRFDLEYDEILVLDVDIVGSATEEVLLLHSIPSIVSKDLEDVIHMVS